MLLPLLLNLGRRKVGSGKKSGYKVEDYEKRRRDIKRRDDMFLMEFLKTATDIINNQ